jgi:D-alanine-D-alanine ligase
MTLQIGIVFEGFDSYPRRPGDPTDFAVEYEPESTVALLESAIAHLGHRAVRIGTPHELLKAVAAGRVSELDAALTIAEGYGTRNREGWAPAILEMAGIPTLGSDALTLSHSLDKAWTNRAVRSAGMAVAPQCLMTNASDALSGELPADFPLFVKPRWEGTSKGIAANSRVESREALVGEVERIVRDYRQAALVEAFLPGAEYTVTVVGNDPPSALAVLQRALHDATGIGLHAITGVHEELGRECVAESEISLPGELDSSLERALQTLAVAVYELFECLDFARVDYRLDRNGEPVFLEINPLPTFALDGSFGILAELQGRAPAHLLSEVLERGLVRLGLT